MSTTIQQAIAVLTCEPNEKVRFMQADAEKAFGKLFSEQSQQTNVPDEVDPLIPRLLFQSGYKQLTISKAAVQLILNFERNELSLEKQFDVFEKNVRDLFPAFLRFLGENSIRESALVLQVNYPRQESMLELNKILYDRFFKMPMDLGDLANAGFQLGFKDKDSQFVNVEAKVYELREKIFDPPVRGPLLLNASELPVIERGFGIKLDVNTRPQRLDGDYSKMGEPSKLLGSLKELLEIKVPTLMGF